MDIGLELRTLLLVRTDLDEDAEVVDVQVANLTEDTDVVLTNLVGELVLEVRVLKDVTNPIRQGLSQRPEHVQAAVQNVAGSRIAVGRSQLLQADQTVRVGSATVAGLVETCDVANHLQVVIHIANQHLRLGGTTVRCQLLNGDLAVVELSVLSEGATDNATRLEVEPQGVLRVVGTPRTEVDLIEAVGVDIHSVRYRTCDDLLELEVRNLDEVRERNHAPDQRLDDALVHAGCRSHVVGQRVLACRLRADHILGDLPLEQDVGAHNHDALVPDVDGLLHLLEVALLHHLVRRIELVVLFNHPGSVGLENLLLVDNLLGCLVVEVHQRSHVTIEHIVLVELGHVVVVVPTLAVLADLLQVLVGEARVNLHQLSDGQRLNLSPVEAVLELRVFRIAVYDIGRVDVRELYASAGKELVLGDADAQDRKVVVHPLAQVRVVVLLEDGIDGFLLSNLDGRLVVELHIQAQLLVGTRQVRRVHSERVYARLLLDELEDRLGDHLALNHVLILAALALRQGVLSVSLDLEDTLGHTVDDDVNELREDGDRGPVQIQVRKVTVDGELVLVLSDVLLSASIQAQAVEVAPLVVEAALVAVLLKPLVLNGLSDHKAVLIRRLLRVRNELTRETSSRDVNLNVLHSARSYNHDCYISAR